jgi:hypothetical protein
MNAPVSALPSSTTIAIHYGLIVGIRHLIDTAGREHK